MASPQHYFGGCVCAIFTMITSLPLLQLQPAAPATAPTFRTVTAPSRLRRTLICFRCSSDSHLANRCPHQGTKCRYCHKIGHLEHACLSKKKAQGQTRVHHLDKQLEFPGEASSDNSLDATMEVPLYKIHANNHNPLYSVEAEINGPPLPIRFEIDTGSAVTIILGQTSTSHTLS